MNQPAINKEELYPDTLNNWYREGNCFVFECDNGVILQLFILSDRMLRFRFSIDKYIPNDFSYAISPDFIAKEATINVAETPRRIAISTDAITCLISKSGLKTRIQNNKKEIILDDDKGFHWEDYQNGNPIVFMSKSADPEESFFGLGDKSCHLNLRNERLQNWVTDCFGYDSHTDPLYRAIPFYYGLRKGNGYGVFFDNSFRTFFDFAKERKNATSFWAHGGEMNYYFIYGPELISVAEQYTNLTGKPELPPLWALGFHQCKWSYYPESVVKDIAAGFRSRQIPCDSIYLDIDYMDGYRCFTWNKDRFPNPDKMIKDLEKDGFKTVVIIDPGIKIDHNYPVFTEALEKDYFCKRSDGPYMKGEVWPGECFFPDFTKPEVRTWWSHLFRDLIRKNGVRGVWNDMNEPAVFEVPSKTFPEDVRHNYDGNPSSHLKAHNVYGMQMSRASYEGVKQYGYPRRPFMITRATYAGGQRFASAWTGDNVANWEHLLLANTQSQRMSISGFSFIGSDIGGFNDTPDGELFVRWLQLGIFHPLCRVHSIGHHDTGDSAIDEDSVIESMESIPNKDQEPWSFGEEFTEIAKKTIELRYKLLPYLYTAFQQYVKNGTPVLRPLSFLDQHDPETLHRMEEFGFGDHLLVCPISEQGVEGRFLYLPKGLWYDFNTHEPLFGEQEIWKDAALDEIPMFARAGSMIPLAPVQQYVGEKVITELTLHAYYKNGGEISYLYSDDGDGYEYTLGEFLMNRFEFRGDKNRVVISNYQEGGFKADYQTFQIIFHGLPYKSRQCLVDGRPVAISFNPTTTSVKVPSDFGQLVIE
ncbi:MAG: glycoside hydrolase family 31 protein [Bacteroidetes bacterium]|nr:glycoside hydrolase family 31 protein [Bacteroidota bacterium]